MRRVPGEEGPEHPGGRTAGPGPEERLVKRCPKAAEVVSKGAAGG